MGPAPLESAVLYKPPGHTKQGCVQASALPSSLVMGALPSLRLGLLACSSGEHQVREAAVHETRSGHQGRTVDGRQCRLCPRTASLSSLFAW